MHTGDRSAEAIDSGGVLPGYEGVIVRDGYAGYGYLTDALHAWCGAHYADAAVMPIPRPRLLVAGGSALSSRRQRCRPSVAGREPAHHMLS
jgi:transposase